MNLMMLHFLISLLAQIPPTPTVESGFFKDSLDVLGWVVAVIVAIAGVLWNMFGQGRERTLGGQPIEVKGADECIKRREFEEHKRDVERAEEAIRKDLEKKFEEQDDRREKQIAGLHNHITASTNGVKAEMGALETRLTNALTSDGKVILDHHGALEGVKARVERLEQGRRNTR